MGNNSKKLTLLLILMFSTSMISSGESARAQSIPTPSIPQFTVQLADHSYDVPPITTSTTNPYTGEEITNTQPSYHVRNITIDLTIVNQPCPSIINGNQSYVYFDVRTKGHFGQDWTELYPYYSNSPVQSDSQFTVISIPANYQVGDQIDIQVQAAIGYKIVIYIGHPPMDVYTESVDFQHASSDWSPTQTITILDSFVSASPNPTGTPNSPDSTNPTSPPSSTVTITPDGSLLGSQQLTDLVLVAAVVVLGVAVVSLLVYVRRIKNRIPKQ